MQTSRENVILAGTQTPLLREEQIVVGALLTGVAMSHLWEVVHLDGRQVFIRKLPATTVPCAHDTHAWSTYGRGWVCSACQVRKQALSEFMPKREEKARVHVLAPRGTLLAPQPYTVYGHLLANGTVQPVSLNGTNWDQTLPIIPALSIIWTIPETLRAMVSNAPAEPEF